jgi:hypothetical protein
VVGDVPVNNETFMATLLILRFAGPTQFFGGAHKGRMCVTFVYVSVCICNWVSKKKAASKRNRNLAREVIIRKT